MAYFQYKSFQGTCVASGRFDSNCDCLTIYRYEFGKHGCPRWQQEQDKSSDIEQQPPFGDRKIKSKYGKNLQVLNFDPAPPQGHVMSVKCEQSIDELTILVWLLYHHLNFKYCTLFVSGTELWTDGQPDRRTVRLLDAPGGTFQAGGIKSV